MQTFFVGKGNLADAPELKHGTSKSGEPFVVANMRVMFGRYGQTDSGEIEQVGGYWRPVEIYGAKAEACAKHLRKGARVVVMGEEREFRARDEDSNEVVAFKIVAEDVALQLTRIESVKYAPSRSTALHEGEPATA